MPVLELPQSGITAAEVAAGQRQNIAQSLKFKGDFEVESGAHPWEQKIGGRGDRKRNEDVMAILDQQRRAGLSPAIVFNLRPMRLQVNTGYTGYFEVPGTNDELGPCDDSLESLAKDGDEVGVAFAKKWKGKVGIKILRGSGIDYPFDMKDMGGGNYAPSAIPPLLMGENAVRQYDDAGIFVVEFQKGLKDLKTGEVPYHAPLAHIEALIEMHTEKLEGHMFRMYQKAESAWAQSNHDGAVIQPPWIAAADFLLKRGLIGNLPEWAHATRSNIDEFTNCYACGHRITIKAAICSACSKVQPSTDLERDQFPKMIRMGVIEPATISPARRAQKIASWEAGEVPSSTQA